MTKTNMYSVSINDRIDEVANQLVDNILMLWQRHNYVCVHWDGYNLAIDRGDISDDAEVCILGTCGYYLDLAAPEDENDSEWVERWAKVAHEALVEDIKESIFR